MLFSVALVSGYAAHMPATTPAYRAAVLPRAFTPVAAAPQPYRTDGKFDYFREMREVSVALPKPLGAVMEEAAPAGVKVEEVQEGGSAFETKLLRKGDRILTVQGADMSQASFDDVMEALVAAPAEVELSVKRVVVIRKPAAAPAAAPKITVAGNVDEVEKVRCGHTCTCSHAHAHTHCRHIDRRMDVLCMYACAAATTSSHAMFAFCSQGVILRTALLNNKVELYKGLMAKAQQCGGAGQCSSCLVEVLEGAENLSPKTTQELKKLSKKPENYRMACQAFVNGDVTVAVP